MVSFSFEKLFLLFSCHKTRPSAAAPRKSDEAPAAMTSVVGTNFDSFAYTPLLSIKFVTNIAVVEQLANNDETF